MRIKQFNYEDLTNFICTPPVSSKSKSRIEYHLITIWTTNGLKHWRNVVRQSPYFCRISFRLNWNTMFTYKARNLCVASCWVKNLRKSFLERINISKESISRQNVCRITGFFEQRHLEYVEMLIPVLEIIFGWVYWVRRRRYCI
jgi:hypothetical protein